MFDQTTLLTVGLAAFLMLLTVTPRWIRYRRQELRAQEKFQHTAGTELNVPASMHPQIDVLTCIGCGSCVRACPEGDVLGLIDGKATLIHAAKCVGHALCAEECPVGAIRMRVGSPGSSADLPVLDAGYQTNIPGLYVVGELGGIGLIKNAVTQGIAAAQQIAASGRHHRPGDASLDVVIVGAGPAGLASALAVKQSGLTHLVLEQGDIGGTILQYPRRKIVLTAPVQLPLYGRLRFTETTKESLLDTWNKIISSTGVAIRTNERVLEVSAGPEGFSVQTTAALYPAANVILALGRRGTPRKLGVPGEHLPNVAYRLIEAESYQGCKILVVGGGDSAVEAAVALAAQKGNRVSLSYRKAEFTRIKERNSRHLADSLKRGRLNVYYGSEVREIHPDRVLLETPEGTKTLPNDFVFIFAGGEMPYPLLHKIGIQFGSQAVSL